MKKFLALVLSMALLFALTACSSDTKTAEPTAEPVVEATEEPAAEPAEEPVVEATEEPAAEPAEEPVVEATEEPAAEPVEEPVVEATEEPAAEPAEEPAEEPAVEATVYHVGICQFVQHGALDAATKGFRDALTELLGDTVVFDEQNASGEGSNCITIINGFLANGVDLIMCNATPPVQAAVAATGEVPILGTSVTDYATALEIADWTGVTGINLSGTSDLAPLDQQAAMIKELFPDAKVVGLLYCSAEPNSAYQIKVVSEQLTAMGYECQEFAFADSNDVSSVTTAACAACDVLYIPTDNTAASCTEAIRSVVEVEKKPVVAGEEGICAGCGVATLSISYYDLGYATGKMAYEVLVNGADVSAMPIEFAPNVTKEYNAEMCELLGITIPEGYTAIAQ